MPSSPRRSGAVVRAVHDSAVGRHPMIQPWHSERSPVACVPRVAVESGRRGVAGQTPVRRWSGTTRCNELAVIVMRDGEPVGRESLIATVLNSTVPHRVVPQYREIDRTTKTMTFATRLFTRRRLRFLWRGVRAS